MQGVFVTAVTVLVELQTRLIVATILLGRVIPFLAFGTSKVDHDSNVLLCHAN